AGERLTLVGASGGKLVAAGRAAGLKVWNEAFADRVYERDGSLKSRSAPDSLIHDPAAAAKQALQLARDGIVAAGDGGIIRMEADTICIHGDGPSAAKIAESIEQALRTAGIQIGKTED